VRAGAAGANQRPAAGSQGLSGRSPGRTRQQLARTGLAWFVRGRHEERRPRGGWLRCKARERGQGRRDCSGAYAQTECAWEGVLASARAGWATAPRHGRATGRGGGYGSGVTPTWVFMRERMLLLRAWALGRCDAARAGGRPGEGLARTRVRVRSGVTGGRRPKADEGQVSTVGRTSTEAATKLSGRQLSGSHGRRQSGSGGGEGQGRQVPGTRYGEAPRVQAHRLARWAVPATQPSAVRLPSATARPHANRRPGGTGVARSGAPGAQGGARVKHTEE
jgi:hypothetical protein